MTVIATYTHLYLMLSSMAILQDDSLIARVSDVQDSSLAVHLGTGSVVQLIHETHKKIGTVKSIICTHAS